jgi:FAD/FMN-containing dehydrogenase/Fe-S oxidoreductase
MTQIREKVSEQLMTSIDGDVLIDNYSRAIYSTDASLYQIEPELIIVPKNEKDVSTALKYARENHLSILPRGGATSLAGQTVGNSLILDFSKYFTKILDFNKEEKWVKVQPGISRDELNSFLSPHELWFAPDPATSSRANIGGMIGNNSSGTKSILYGKTVDHILELKILLSDGSILIFNEKSEIEYNSLCNQDNLEGSIYREFRKMVFEHSAEIKKVFPKVMRRVGGYNLDEFTKTNNWNLGKLITGSEGTLAIILEAKINLEDLPKVKAVSVVHFKDRIQSIKAVETIIRFNPAAVEILDKTVLDLSRKNILTSKHSHWISGDPGAVLIIEFYGDTPDEIKSRFEKMITELKDKKMGYHYPFYPEGKIYNEVWLIRKKGLGLLLGRQGKRKAVAFIEDSAIPIKHLPNYIDEVVSICDSFDVETAVYAHASVGVIHVRPFLDMTDSSDIELFKQIAEKTFLLVKKYGGSWSGEHGDGLVRSPFNKRFFGDTIYKVFQDIKALFDPENIMNPGKIIDAPPPDTNLRYGQNYKDQIHKSIYKFKKEGSFEDMVHMCNGVGECRKKSGGTMCPSYKATLDEKHTTRGRANALRMTMSGQMKTTNLANQELLDVLDLCLSCKACKSECPSNVDMAKLKSEVWQHKYDSGKISIREKFISNAATISKKYSGFMAPVINSVQRSLLFRWSMDTFFGITKERKLPSYSKYTLTSWYKKKYQPTPNPVDRVALFADTYLNYHEADMGIEIIQFLQSCNLEVQLIDVGCCQRPRISNGFLRKAKKDGTVMVSNISGLLEKDIPILVCEPSCASALQDDLPDLIEDSNHATKLTKNVLLIETYIADAIESGKFKGNFSSKFSNIVYHGHCHEKAIYGTKAIHDIFNSIKGVDFQEIDSGCCGMAGSFGYEKEHYNVSKLIALNALVPQLEKYGADYKIVSSGFSCRHQINDMTSSSAIHWIQALDY